VVADDVKPKRLGLQETTASNGNPVGRAVSCDLLRISIHHVLVVRRSDHLSYMDRRILLDKNWGNTSA
jgi:hypothetical protein